jgi:hypothetical protein
MITRISEIIHDWLGWCPNGPMQGTTRSPDISEISALASPDRQRSPVGAIPGVIGGERYRNLQISYFFTAGMIVAIILGVYNSLIYYTPFARIPAILFTILVIVAWLVSASLTVRIYDDLLEIKMGLVSLGLNKRRIPLTEIESVRMEEKPNEKAIRYFIARADPGKFRSGVTIELRTGKTIRIGTAEPEVLMHALNDAIADAAKMYTGGVLL